MSALANDRVVLVAGSRGDIGESICGFFLNQGARVIGCGRSSASIEHERFQHHICDISSEKAVMEMYFALDRSQITPEVLVVNAAAFSLTPVMLLGGKEIANLLSINVAGLLFLARETLKRMTRRRFGRIIMLSSIAVSKPVRGSSLYAMTKAALEQFTRNLPLEIEGSGVTVNAIEISVFDSGMALRLSPQARASLMESLAIKRPCTAEDLCNALDFFARPESSYVTGQVLKLGFV